MIAFYAGGRLFLIALSFTISGYSQTQLGNLSVSCGEEIVEGDERIVRIIRRDLWQYLCVGHARGWPILLKDLRGNSEKSQGR